ncbi:hypothetical protein MTO98_07430 [Mucilaginibacter sp. SMC90]|uniref:lanthionine synthetase LanC family protein n=1 Tax=Mucilaginibacter sp. SMC90 TaxID=2929803 RepID=UPI001FB5618B|nr:lanthionine synthetase LanC family protein [Mucilaginibacter sp. SMC90]UOE50908.1 hypothetical protein MTO98_07430 [Mucilaginibacter sp. SMC90]
MKQTQISQQNCTIRQSNVEGNHRTSNANFYYSYYLREQDFSVAYADPYLIAGAFNEIETWLIHITVVRQQFDQLIRPLLAFLKPIAVSFAIPANADHHSTILDGRSGFSLTGKVITIYATTLEQTILIVRHLCTMTKSIIGPSMPCAYHLTDTIGISYGALFTQNDDRTTIGSTFYGSAIADELKQIIDTNNIAWPFQGIRPLVSFKQPRLLNKQYIPVETFKKDPKGNVFKALKINRIFDMQWCVVKQGRKYQSFDNSGRDAKDRLSWQFGIHKQFESKNILPKAIAYFELYGDAFFVMDYKESISLTEKAVQLSEGNTWRAMPAERKREMLSYLLQVINILGQFHDEGFAHRDVTPANFIVSETGQVFAIDIELCYNLRTQSPNPPFTLGTPGFMSPAQENGHAPSLKDDIFSVGALLISVLTSVLPNKLNAKDLTQLKTTLYYFIDSPALVHVIIGCLVEDPTHRPTLAEIRDVLDLCDTVLLTTTDPIPVSTPPLAHKSSVIIVNDAFQSLSNVIFGNRTKISEKALVVNTDLNGKPDHNGFTLIKTPGFAELAVLAIYHHRASATFNAKFISHIQSWLAQIITIELPDLELQILATALSQIKPGTELLLDLMGKVIPAPENNDTVTLPGISGGIAGRGLKLLYLTDQQCPGPDLQQLTDLVRHLTEIQNIDGSWTITSESSGKKTFKVIGFSHGVAGIIYFLLNYYARFKSDNLRVRTEASLKWLIKQRRSDKGKMTWPVSAENQTVDPWLEHGFSGVALTFIKAYEVLGHSIYREIAEEVLAYHPLHITSNYCAFGNGLSGLGEIYLEAKRVFGNEEWQFRASIIRDTLLNSCFRDDNVCYWLDGTQLNPTPDFWTGNAGILHFLHRFEYPDQIHFPAHLIP